MADMQKYFNHFHDEIKLEYEDNKVLRDQRDEILDELKSHLKADSRKVRVFQQGSYSMYTGIKALDKGDYDIDVGLIFEIDIDEYENPVIVKNWVYDNLIDKYPDIKMKKPCVTIEFESEEKDSRNYHVDFAIYGEDIESNEIYLAKGKLHSTEDNKEWELSEPENLVKMIKEHYEDKDERSQFRRVVRYMKRWKDIKFKGQVNKPSGIGITLSALELFEPNIIRDPFNNDVFTDDLKVIECFVTKLLNNFNYTSHEGEYKERLTVVLPTKPYKDVYEGISNIQMEEFKDKLQSLQEDLKVAIEEVDPIIASEILRKSFGEDFKIEDEKEMAKQKSRPIISNHSSAYDTTDTCE